jgi:hypothetical protein
MFIGEMMCLVAFYLQPYITRSRNPSSSNYEALAQDETLETQETSLATEASTTPPPLAGWARLLFLLPTLCDLTGTTLMNIGLIYTPVSIYQMTRGLLVLWVGVLSVIFLRRKLFAYQWVCLVLVTSGVALVGLAGSLVKRSELPGGEDDLSLLKRAVIAVANIAGQEDPTKVFIGVLFIAGAQIFTASQFVSHFRVERVKAPPYAFHLRQVIEEKILSSYSVEPLVSSRSSGMCTSVCELMSRRFTARRWTRRFLRRSPHPHLHADLASAIFISFRLFQYSRWLQPDYRQPKDNDNLGRYLRFDRAVQLVWSICYQSRQCCCEVSNHSRLMVSKPIDSSFARSTIDTSRTLTIWMVSLALGWEVLTWPYSLLQITGFALLV